MGTQTPRIVLNYFPNGCDVGLGEASRAQFSEPHFVVIGIFENDATYQNCKSGDDIHKNKSGGLFIFLQNSNKNKTNVQMSDRRFSAIHPRAKLPGAAHFRNKTKKVTPNIFGYTFS